MCENEEGDFHSGKGFVCELCVDTKEGIVEPG